MGVKAARAALSASVAALAAAALACGCTCTRSADRAKAEVAPVAAGDAAAPRAPDLRGAGLGELVDFAMSSRPEVSVAENAVEDARLALFQLAADAPLIGGREFSVRSLGVGLSGGRSGASDAANDVGDLKPKTHGVATAALSLDLLVWDAGRSNARVAAQVERVIAAEMSLVSAQWSVFREVSQSYFDLLEKRALLRAALTNEATYAVHLEQAERRLEAGEANKLDVLRSRLDVAQARERTVNISNDVRVCEAKMLSALGLSASRVSCDDVVGADSNGLDRVTRCLASSSEDLGEMFAFARTNSPGLALCRARLRAAMSDVDFARADLMPSVSASVSLNWTDPSWLWKWGVNGVWSLFEGFGRTAALKRAVVAMRSSAEETLRAEQTLSADLEIAIASRDNAAEALRAAGESLARARENLRQVSEMFGIGEASRVEYTLAVSDYTAALGSRISAFYSAQRAEAEISALVGGALRYDEGIIREDEL